MEKLTSQEIQALILKLVLEHKHGKDNWNTALVRAVELVRAGERHHGIGVKTKDAKGVEE
jgi:hypothetical protein